MVVSLISNDCTNVATSQDWGSCKYADIFSRQSGSNHLVACAASCFFGLFLLVVRCWTTYTWMTACRFVTSLFWQQIRFFICEAFLSFVQSSPSLVWSFCKGHCFYELLFFLSFWTPVKLSYTSNSILTVEVTTLWSTLLILTLFFSLISKCILRCYFLFLCHHSSPVFCFIFCPSI